MFNNSSTVRTPVDESAGTLGAVFLAVLTCIIITAVVGNLIVICAFCICKKLRERATNYFIVSLALSDLMTASLVMPFDWGVLLNNGVWTHSTFACDFFVTMYLLAAPGSIINLCAVTIDRYVVLKMPLRYKTIMPPKRALTIIICLWLYALVVACLPQMGWRTPGVASVRNNYCYFVISAGYIHFVNFVNFLLPILFVAFFWWRIYLIARRHFNRMQTVEKNIYLNADPTSSSRDLYPTAAKSQSRRTRRHLKGARYIAMVVCLFFVCWLPLVVLGTVPYFCTECKKAIPPLLYESFLMLAYMNSALNPFLYPFHDRQYKRAICGLFIKLKKNWQKVLSRCRRNPQN